MQHKLLPSFVINIINLGVKAEMPFTEQRNIRLSNAISAFVVVSSLFYNIPLFFDDQIDKVVSISANIASVVAGFLVILMNYRCQPIAARVFMFSFFTIYVLAIPLVFKQFTGEIVYLFGIITGTVLLFDNKFLIKILFFITSLAIIAHLLLFSSPIAYIPFKISWSFFCVTTPLGLLVIYNTLMGFKYESEIYQQKIEEQNNVLQQQQFEIAEQNHEITEQNHELQAQQVAIAEQNIVLEHKNKQILDSINYASRIQKAILPLLTNIEKVLPQHFVFYLPKDIVSGDFYWFEYVPEQQISVLAVADCTGHGVSGCLMSMIGANTLTQIVDELKIYEPDKILNELDRKVRQLLKQDGDKQAINDGMDVALCVIQQTNISTHLAFAGAKRPLLLFQNGEMTEYKGDKSPIGSSFYESKSFTAHHFELQQGATIYIFSDGITDQFDASNTKKFTSKRLKELLQNLQTLPLNKRKKQIENTFFEWKGKTAQTDDVLLMGIEI